MSDTSCCNCGEAASGHHSLPVDDDGDIIANTSRKDWAGRPSCEACYLLHQAGGANGVNVLVAYVRVSGALRERLRLARAAIAGTGKTMQAALDRIGEHPL